MKSSDILSHHFHQFENYSRELTNYITHVFDIKSQILITKKEY